MPDPDELAHLQRLLKIYQRNLQTLENQAGSFGGENMAPLPIQNQLMDTREKIANWIIDCHRVGSPYQLALVMPGTCPKLANSRSAIRDIFTLR